MNKKLFSKNLIKIYPEFGTVSEEFLENFVNLKKQHHILYLVCQVFVISHSFRLSRYIFKPIGKKIFAFLYSQLILRNREFVGEINPQTLISNFDLTETEFDVVVIGSGPGASVAALRAAENGQSVLILEKGLEYSSSQINHHSPEQLKYQFKNSGFGIIYGNKPAIFTEGETVGGSSEVNSGLYYRLSGIHRDKFLKSLKIDSSEFQIFEDKIEKMLFVQKEPIDFAYRNDSLKVFIDGSNKLGLECQEIPRWRSYKPHIVHESMSQTYLRKLKSYNCLIVQSARVDKLIPLTNYISVRFKDKNSDIKFVKARKVILGAGTLATPEILFKSRLARSSEFQFNFHPMIRAVAKFNSQVNDGDLFPPWQSWTKDLKFKFGYSVSTKEYFKATFNAVGGGKNGEKLEHQYFACYFASFILTCRIRFLRFKRNGQAVPFVWFNKADKKHLKQSLDLLKQILIKGGAEEVWPKNLDSPVSTVHVFGSIPLGANKITDGYGRLLKEPRIRISDASLLPFAPWGNPQGPIMALCEYLAELNINWLND